ncbi:MAG: hypothetical protein FWF96_04320, partial [Kiritimatiellaeota bacterium]|nr:hypothetical protein [Kiritimatiellota bacterium]
YPHGNTTVYAFFHKQASFMPGEKKRDAKKIAWQGASLTTRWISDYFHQITDAYGIYEKIQKYKTS